METQITYAKAQANLDRLCEQVVETGEAVVITRQIMTEIEYRVNFPCFEMIAPQAVF